LEVRGSCTGVKSNQVNIGTEVPYTVGRGGLYERTGIRDWGTMTMDIQGVGWGLHYQGSSEVSINNINK